MPTERSTPVGRKLDDGFRALYAFAADPDVSIWEKAVTPIGGDGGDPIPTQTQHNVLYRTKAARKLIDTTNGAISVAYDPAVYPQIFALLNVEGLVTIHFPDGSSVDFYGYLKSFVPGPLVEGEQPEANCEIISTNVNPDTGAEVAPVYNPPGTA